MKRFNVLAAALGLMVAGCQSTPMSEAAVEPIYFVDQSPKATSYNVPLAPDLQAYTLETCKRFGIAQPEIIFGLMEHESDFDPTALSMTGDVGLMQINPVSLEELAAQLGTVDLYDPMQNIEAGIYLISKYEQKYNSWPMALMAYNLGETGAMEYWDAGIYSTDYSDQILINASEIQELT